MTLLARIEAATPDQQADLLREVWEALHPEPPDKWQTWDSARIARKDEADKALFGKWLDHQRGARRFTVFLDAHAYVDAALSMVPPGLYPTIDFVANRAWLRDANGFDTPNGCAFGFAQSVPLALLAAIVRATGKDRL